MPTQTFFNLPDAKREQIHQIALEEFAAQPYQQVSISNIVRRAGIAKGSFYQYFTDKKDLFLYLIQKGGELKLQFLSGRRPEVKGDFFSGYRDMMTGAIEFGVTYPLESKLLTQIYSHAMEGPLRDEIRETALKMAEDFHYNLVREAQQRGELRDDLPVDLIVYYFNTLTAEFGRYFTKVLGLERDDIYKPEHEEKILALDLETMITQLIELMRSGMCKK